MTDARPRTLILLGLAATLALWTAAPAEAFLVMKGSSGSAPIGYPLNQQGTRYTESSGVIPVRINLARGSGMTNQAGVYQSWSYLSTAQRNQLTSVVTQALDYWNNVPDAAIRWQLVGTTTTTSPLAMRNELVITIASLPSGVLGASYSNSYGSQTYQYGIILANLDLLTVVHELGHSLAFEHSSCGDRLTYNSAYGYTRSGGAFMSYSRTWTDSVLHEDDMAAVASTYPRSASYLKDHGTIRGHLRKSNGGGLFGANVFAIDSSKRAVVSRITGTRGWSGAGASNGKFELPRLEPGEYTVVATSMYSQSYYIGVPLNQLNYNSLQSYYPGSVATTTIRKITVTAGGVTDLGNVTVGSTTDHSGGSGDGGGGDGGGGDGGGGDGGGGGGGDAVSTTWSWASINYPVEYWYIRVYQYSTGTYLADQALSAGTLSHTFDATPGRYQLQRWARIYGQWYQIENRTVTY